MTDDKIIKDAQYRKGLSIAFFNATNAAISLVSSHHFDKQTDSKGLVLRVCEIRDYFLNEHKEYYANVIAQVGSNYDAKLVIEKLKTCKTLEDLTVYWVSITADERKDGEIRKVAADMKIKLK